jgi:hypothetical protein
MVRDIEMPGARARRQQCDNDGAEGVSRVRRARHGVPSTACTSIRRKCPHLTASLRHVSWLVELPCTAFAFNRLET